MKIRYLGWLLFGWCVTAPIISLQATAETIVTQSTIDRSSLVCTDDLAQNIDSILDRPKLRRAYWGIAISSIDTGDNIYSLNADKYFTPASVAKLLTTAAALLTLDSDFRIHTPIYSRGKPPYLTSLRLKGQGDPTISTQSLKNIVHQLRQKGIKSIETLIIDDSYFSQPHIEPTWEWSDIYNYYAPAVNSTILDRNTVTLTLFPQQIGQPVKFSWSNSIAARQWQINNRAISAPPNTNYSIELNSVLGRSILNISGKLPIDRQPDIWDLAIVDPANYFLESWRQVLLLEGITVDRAIVIDRNLKYPGETELTRIISPKISDLITETNRESNNLYAEVLLKFLESKFNTNNPQKAVSLSLSRLNIDSNSYQLVDGSGLSRHDRITPQTLVRVLQQMAQTQQFQTYYNSLAIAGKNGTLVDRFKQTKIQNHLWAKTGTLSGVASLAGYLTLPNREPLVLAIMVNNSDLSGKELRQAIDEIILLLDNWNKC
jgi:D-alanyl-D-alanine carboxypeptidase/D-alanyl-D-alanine-endopeptidase (penicillin-binding protein 4)